MENEGGAVYRTSMAEKLSAARARRAEVFRDQIRQFLLDNAARLDETELANLNKLVGSSDDAIISDNDSERGIFDSVRSRITGTVSNQNKIGEFRKAAISGDAVIASVLQETVDPDDEKSVANNGGEDGAAEDVLTYNKPQMNAPAAETKTSLETDIVDTPEYRAFIARLDTYDAAALHDKERSELESPLRGTGGEHLNILKVADLFRATLANECGLSGGHGRPVIHHLYDFFVREKLNRVRSLRRELSNAKDKAEKFAVSSSLQEAERDLMDRMYAIVADLRSDESEKQFGVDPNKIHVETALLRIDEDEKWELLTWPEEECPDPLYVNGVLPLPKPLGDACRHIFERAYGAAEEDEEARQVVRVIKEKTVNQLIRELETADRMPRKSKEERTERNKTMRAVVERLTTVMRALVNTAESGEKSGVGVEEYYSYIRTGERPEGVVSLASVDKRPPHNIFDITNPQERTAAIKQFYKDLVSNYSTKELKQLGQLFDDQSNKFFRDEAGPKSERHIYYDLCKVLSTKYGLDERLAPVLFGHVIEAELTKLREIRAAEHAMYTKRADLLKAGNLDYGAWQSELAEIKAGRGEVRKAFLKQAVELGKRSSEFGGLDILEGEDPVEAVLAEEEVEVDESLEDKLDELIEKLLTGLDNSDTRKERFDAFAEELNRRDAGYDESIRQSNTLAQDNDFMAARDEGSQALTELRVLMYGAEAPDPNQVIEKAKRVLDLQATVFRYYDDIINSESDNETDQA